MTRIAVRGYVEGKPLFNERIEVGSDAELTPLAKQQMLRLLPYASRPHMVEIEFLDEPDPNERFFRFGSDPTGMVLPIKVDLGDVP